jgi:hypothetical protein
LRPVERLALVVGRNLEVARHGRETDRGLGAQTIPGPLLPKP